MAPAARVRVRVAEETKGLLRLDRIAPASMLLVIFVRGIGSPSFDSFDTGVEFLLALAVALLEGSSCGEFVIFRCHFVSLFSAFRRYDIASLYHKILVHRSNFLL